MGIIYLGKVKNYKIYKDITGDSDFLLRPKWYFRIWICIRKLFRMKLVIPGYVFIPNDLKIKSFEKEK